MSKATVTRMTILQKAFELIYTKGYQTTSIDEIIATTKVTKGAFYYHFKTKDEMGLAIIEEIVRPTMQESFITPLSGSTDPLSDIYTMTKQLLLENPFLTVEHGCPAGNLTQEMTPWNHAFSEALSSIINQWKTTIEEVLENGKTNGSINPDVNVRQAAYFIMSGYWGIRNFGKLDNNKDSYYPYLQELKRYLEGLK
ncbi:MAG: TetR/AcrR family transcriptional regulator [Bacteroidota bacterium]